VNALEHHRPALLERAVDRRLDADENVSRLLEEAVEERVDFLEDALSDNAQAISPVGMLVSGSTHMPPSASHCPAATFSSVSGANNSSTFNRRVATPCSWA